MDTTIDPQVKNLVSAIGQAETGPSSPEAYQQKGASGEFGRYQFMPDTYKEYAQKYLGDANAEPTIENQNKIAYSFVKEKKDAGYTPAQIASMWNAGEHAPNAYKEGNVGTNKEGVAYNTPAYVQKVSQYYNQLKSQTQTPTSQTSQGTSILPNVGDIGTELGQNIANRFQQGSQTISNISTSLGKGDLLGAGSGLLQTAGAAAGGVGDIANAALEFVPGVQAVEHGISNALGSFAQTDTGKNIVQGMSQFAQAHPEISGDIGAAVNIASVIPMFKGLSLIKGGLTDAITAPLKSNLEEAAGNEIRNNLTTQASRNSLASAERRGLDPVKFLTSNHENLPSIVNAGNGNFVYDGTKAAQGIQSSLAQDEQQMQSMLSQGISKNIGVNLNDARQQMLKDVLAEFKGRPATGADAASEVNKFFDKIDQYEAITSKRSVIDINELNDLKRDLGGQINWQNLGVKAGDIKSSMYRSFMKQVEGYASKAGVKGVGDLNKTMGEKIESMKLLKSITGKKVKQSGFGKILREVGADVAGGAGELAGNAAGIPFASTLAGRSLYRIMPGSTPMTATRLLGRSGRGTIKSSIGKGLLKAGTAQGLRGLVQLPPTGQQ